MPDEARPLRGVLLIVLATLSFAAADVLTKDLAMRLPVPVAMAGRYLVTLVILTLLFYPRRRARLWRVSQPLPVLARGLCLALASLTFAAALKRMPVAETVAIVYLSPFLVMLAAVPLLGERISALGWGLAALGFAGVLLILRPGTGLDPLGVLLALSDAVLTTAYHLLTRRLSTRESLVALMFHTALVGSVFFGVSALPYLPGLVLGPADLAAMAGLGLLATLGHFAFTAALREAPASTLAPVNYLHLVWAAILGWLVFGHLPDAVTLAGMALICLSGAGIASRSGRRSRSG